MHHGFNYLLINLFLKVCLLNKDNDEHCKKKKVDLQVKRYRWAFLLSGLYLGFGFAPCLDIHLFWSGGVSYRLILYKT